MSNAYSPKSPQGYTSTRAKLLKWFSQLIFVLLFVLNLMIFFSILTLEGTLKHNADVVEKSPTVTGIQSFEQGGIVTTGDEQFPGLTPPNPETETDPPSYMTNYDFKALQDEGIINPNAVALIDWGRAGEGALTNETAEFIVPMSTPALMFEMYGSFLLTALITLLVLFSAVFLIRRNVFGWRWASLLPLSVLINAAWLLLLLAQSAPNYEMYKAIVFAAPVVATVLLWGNFLSWARYRSMHRLVRNPDPSGSWRKELKERFIVLKDLKGINERSLADKAVWAAHTPLGYNSIEPTMRVGTLKPYMGPGYSKLLSLSPLQFFGYISVVAYVILGVVYVVFYDESNPFISGLPNALVIFAFVALANILFQVFWPFKTDRYIYRDPYDRVTKSVLKDYRKEKVQSQSAQDS